SRLYFREQHRGSRRFRRGLHLRYRVRVFHCFRVVIRPSRLLAMTFFVWRVHFRSVLCRISKVGIDGSSKKFNH
uniref:Uncharacterized protein n=1 Tax=Parascaris univalens TaxID=6257 RepID=A0A914ZUS5_PARUN